MHEPKNLKEKVGPTVEADKYVGLGREYEEPETMSFSAMPVLEFLWGRAWDDYALNFVHALRPSIIRVIIPGRGVKLDSYLWRVTVGLDEDNRKIAFIEQEVEVGCRHVEDGLDLERKKLGGYDDDSR